MPPQVSNLPTANSILSLLPSLVNRNPRISSVVSELINRTIATSTTSTTVNDVEPTRTNENNSLFNSDNVGQFPTPTPVVDRPVPDSGSSSASSSSSTLPPTSASSTKNSLATGTPVNANRDNSVFNNESYKVSNAGAWVFWLGLALLLIVMPLCACLCYKKRKGKKRKSMLPSSATPGARSSEGVAYTTESSPTSRFARQGTSQPTPPQLLSINTVSPTNFTAAVNSAVVTDTIHTSDPSIETTPRVRALSASSVHDALAIARAASPEPSSRDLPSLSPQANRPKHLFAMLSSPPLSSVMMPRTVNGKTQVINTGTPTIAQSDTAAATASEVAPSPGVITQGATTIAGPVSPNVVNLLKKFNPFSTQDDSQLGPDDSISVVAASKR